MLRKRFPFLGVFCFLFFFFFLSIRGFVDDREIFLFYFLVGLGMFLIDSDRLEKVGQEERNRDRTEGTLSFLFGWGWW